MRAKRLVILVVVLVVIQLCYASELVLRINSSAGLKQLIYDLHEQPWVVYFRLGNFLFENKYTQDSINAFMKSVKLNPKFEKSYHNLGVAYYQQGNLGTAIKWFKKAVELNPNYVKAHYSLGLAYYYNQDLDSAIDEIFTVIELDNTNANATFDAGIMLVERYKNSGNISDLRTAAKLFRRADSIEPGFPHAASNAEIVESVLREN